MTPQELKAIFQKVTQGNQTDLDLMALRDVVLCTGDQYVFQLGGRNINIQQGRDVSIDQQVSPVSQGEISRQFFENYITPYSQVKKHKVSKQNNEIKVESLAKESKLLQVSKDKVKQAQNALDRLPKVVDTIKKRTSANRKLRNTQIMSLDEKISILANDINLSSQLILSFFSCEPVKRGIFINISSHLNLDWKNILDLKFLKIYTSSVEPIRNKLYEDIEFECGTLKLLEGHIKVKDIYVEVNILTRLIRYSRLQISQLPKVYNRETDEFDRLSLGKVTQNNKRIPGLEAAQKNRRLMVLGKPGSGKTTFLKYLSIQCNQEDFRPDQVPFFIRLKDYSKTVEKENNVDFFHYLCKICRRSNIESFELEKLLTYGKAMFLLDGLDEVSESIEKIVVKQLTKFFQDYFKNQFILTCRIATKEYVFPKFEEVEIADFNSEQIEDFAKKWFVANHEQFPEEEQLKKARQFTEKLNIPKNQAIRAIVITPILLMLACLYFEEMGDFPSNRATLYEEGLDILLERWDVRKDVQRDYLYKNLTSEKKKELLTYIASITFEKNSYFFEQAEVENYIADYLRTLPNTDLSSLKEDSKNILSAIEVQHGLLVERARKIYSFSHLTFHEYFTAKAFIKAFKSQATEKIGHLTQKSWREVFLLASGMMHNVDDLLKLMKQRIDELVISDQNLQQFLTWVFQKSQSVLGNVKPAASRAFYFNLVLKFDSALVSNLDLQGFLYRDPVLERGRNLVHDEALALARDIGTALAHHHQIFENSQANIFANSSIEFFCTHAYPLAYILFYDLKIEDIADEFKFDPTVLQYLDPESIDQLMSSIDTDIQDFNLWWEVHCTDWTKQFFDLIFSHYNLDDSECISANTSDLELAYSLTCDLVSDLNVACPFDVSVEPDLKNELRCLREQLPSIYIEGTKFFTWWESNGKDWLNQLRNNMIKYRNIGHIWNFNDIEISNKLKPYYNANSLLLECLNTASNVSIGLQQEIEDTLLFPSSEIELPSATLRNRGITRSPLTIKSIINYFKSALWSRQ